MKVLVLSPYPEFVVEAIGRERDRAVVSTEPLTKSPDADFIVSYGYRHIIPPKICKAFRGHSVNLHISLLPWNRGSDPNFWSWFDDTPKGVTMHEIDEGLDTGPVIDQEVVRFAAYPDETLKTSWHRLRCAAEIMFRKRWTFLRRGLWLSEPQNKLLGTLHRQRDKERFWSELPLGYDTPVAEVAALGRKHRSGELNDRPNQNADDRLSLLHGLRA